jgi:hypothetical protein
MAISLLISIHFQKRFKKKKGPTTLKIDIVASSGGQALLEATMSI